MRYAKNIFPLVTFANSVLLHPKLKMLDLILQKNTHDNLHSNKQNKSMFKWLQKLHTNKSTDADKFY